ncbi:MAG: alpha/beta hydrolase [Actinomycetota bacterium]
MQTLQLDFDDVSLEAHRYAKSGPLACLLPGLGGGIRRFAQLGDRLADSGLQPVAINPRGAGSSTGALENLRMGDLAHDVANVIERLGPPAFLIGNAYGNRVARCVASTRPELVRAVVLVCAGGEVPAEPDAAAALGEFFDESLSEADRLAAAQRALFAPGNAIDAHFIDPGRTAAAARAQTAATRAESADSWIAGGTAPMLVVQGADDRIAPPENGHRLKARWPDRVQVVDVPNAGHAVLNEQPAAVASAILEFFTTLS